MAFAQDRNGTLAGLERQPAAAGGSRSKQQQESPKGPPQFKLPAPLSQTARQREPSAGAAGNEALEPAGLPVSRKRGAGQVWWQGGVVLVGAGGAASDYGKKREKGGSGVGAKAATPATVETDTAGAVGEAAGAAEASQMKRYRASR